MMVWFRWFSVSIGWFFRFHANLPWRTLILLMVQKFGEPIDVGFYIPVSIEFLYIQTVGVWLVLNHQQYLFKPIFVFHWMNSSLHVLRVVALSYFHYWIWLTNDPQQISCLSHQVRHTSMSLVIPVSLISWLLYGRSRDQTTSFSFHKATDCLT